MAFIEGRTLAELIEPDKPWPARKAAEIVRQLALALHEAHRQSVVHRDLKPANVMINASGGLIIMDFGLARRFDAGDATFTATGAVLGTPGYMPPEQAEGDNKAIGPRSDIYSLGVILYELLTGRRPYEGSAVRVLAQILMVDPPPPSARNPAVDRRLEAICGKAMARELEQRHASMNDFAESLRVWLEGQAPDEAREPAPSSVAPPRPGRAGPESTWRQPPSKPPNPQPSTWREPSRVPPPSIAPASTMRPSIVPFVAMIGLGFLSVPASVLVAWLESGPYGPQGHNMRVLVTNIVAYSSILLALGSTLVAVSIGSIKVYRGWQVIQPLRHLDPGEANMPTPGWAVGLLFVPLFNFYWAFTAILGLARRTNRYLERVNPEVEPMNEDRALWVCILFALGIVPLVTLLAWLVDLPLVCKFLADLDRVWWELVAPSEEDPDEFE